MTTPPEPTPETRDQDWASKLASNLRACDIISSRDVERVAKQAREHLAAHPSPACAEAAARATDEILHQYSHQLDGCLNVRRIIAAIITRHCSAQLAPATRTDGHLWRGACEVAGGDPVQVIHGLRAQITATQDRIATLEHQLAEEARPLAPALQGGEADDEVGITEAWLKSEGFQSVPSSLGPEYADHLEKDRLNLWEFNDTGAWLFEDADHIETRTRGDVRALAKLLKVPMSKPAVASPQPLREVIERARAAVYIAVRNTPQNASTQVITDAVLTAITPLLAHDKKTTEK